LKQECQKEYGKDTKVTLTANPIDDNFTFDKWTDDCKTEGSKPSIEVVLDGDKTCGASFEPKPKVQLTLQPSSGGKVVVTTDNDPTPSLICASNSNPNDCIGSYGSGTTVTLEAIPDKPTTTDGTDGFVFYKWTEACQGSTSPITIELTAGTTCGALFTPSIKKDGNYVCINGLSQEKDFSWLLRDNKITANTKQRNSRTPPVGMGPSDIAPYLVTEMGISSKVNDNCFRIPNNTTLFVSYPDAPFDDDKIPFDTTKMCEVKASPNPVCKFNPTIELVPEAQMLTTIRGFVWNDTDESGLQEPGESYLPNSTVRLKRPDGSEGFAFTDVNGYYEFTGLSTGNYTVSAETRTGAIYITSEIETVKVDSINIPMSVSFGMKTVIPNTAQLQIIPSDNGIVSGVIGSGMLYCGYGDNVLGPDCLVNFSINPVPFGVIKAVPKAGYSFVAWSDPSICPNATAELCNPILSGGKNLLSLSATFKLNGEPTIDPNVIVGGNVLPLPTISNVQLSSYNLIPGSEIGISFNSTNQTKYVVYLYDNITNLPESDAPCPSNSFHPTEGNSCLLYGTSTDISTSIKWSVPWILPAGQYTFKVAVGNSSGWSDAIVATSLQEALTYLEITPPDNGIISGYIGSTTIYCGHGDNNTIGDKCSAPGFSANIMRILTAIPKQGYTFSQWSDASVCGFVTDTSCLPTTTGSNAKLTANFTATETPKPTVRIVAAKVPDKITSGENFDVTLQFIPDTMQPADGIQIYLEFDPSKLRVNKVTNSGVLDFELQNEIGGNYIDFAAGVFDNSPPLTPFDLVTINFTALESTGGIGTLLHFDSTKSQVAHLGEYIPQEYSDIKLVIEDILQCKVNLQGRNSVPSSSWETELRLYFDGASYPLNTDNFGHCELPQAIPLSDHSICVKSLTRLLYIYLNVCNNKQVN